MSSIKTKQSHVVLLPFPAQGHLNGMMRIAKLLHWKGFYITYVNTEFNHKRLIRSKGPDSVKGLPDFKFETIPDGLPPSDEDASQDVPALCDSTRKNSLKPFKELLSRLNSSVHDVPPVSCVVIDGLMTFGIKAAQEMGIPDVLFWSPSVGSFVAFLYYRELVEREICPFKNDDYLTDGTLDTPIDWMTGMVDSIRLRDLPSFMRITDPNDLLFNFIGEEVQNSLRASAVIFNTFDEFDKEGLDALISKFNFSNIYTIGPLPLLCRHITENRARSMDSSLWKPDSKVFDWLDSQKPKSVVYVNYGSMTTMTRRHFQEFAWGLAQSKQSFLWIIRPDLVKDESATLSNEFMEEIKDRGLLVSWCVQDQVLIHESVGAFLTHCGWNSIMESVCGSVPVICWPFFGDQQTNCHYLCEKWAIGVEIDNDVKRDEVAKMVREMMEGEKGKEMRRNVQKWKRIAEEDTDIGGSSYEDFNKLIKDALYLQD